MGSECRQSRRPGWRALLPLVAASIAAAGCGRHEQTALRIPRFVDVTAASGLPTAGQTSGAVLVDLDRDGRADLVIGRHGRVPEAYRNLGDLRFERMPEWGRGFAVFDHHATLADDLDGDGAPDFYFVVGAERGEGTGAKTLYLSSEGHAADAAGRWGVQDPYGRGRGALLLDAAGGGARDLLVLDYRTALRAFRLGPPPPGRDVAAPARDVAGDLFGLPPADDAAVARVLAAGGASEAARHREEYVTALLPQDLDGDGRPDGLALGGPPVRVLRWAGGRIRPDLAALPQAAYIPEPVAGAWGDFDGDGRPDLYLACGEDDASGHFALPRRNRLLLGRGGRFVERADTSLALGGAGVACAAADLDDNGALDLVVLQANRGEGRSRWRILLNEGGARFAAPLVSPDVAGIGESLLVADLDGDGDLDLLALVGAIGPDDRGGGVRLYRNDPGAAPGRAGAAHWLEVELDAGAAAGDPRVAALPYGARVEVRAGGRRQTRQCWPAQVGGSAFRAPVRFGLGEAARVERLAVIWPTGERSTLEGIPADQRITVRRR